MNGSSRLKIHWGASKTTPGKWYLGLIGRYERKSGGGRRRRGWAVSLRGVVCWAAFGAVSAWFGGAGYVWLQQTRQAHNEVTYTDVLLYPLRKDEIQAKRGRAMIAAGRDALEAGDSRGGFMLLRLGLERYPHDAEARLLVARFFLASRLRTHAQATLMPGLDHGWPGREYLEGTLEIVRGGEDFELAMEICDRALTLHDPAVHSAEDRRWLLGQRVRAALSAGENEAALAYVDAHADELGLATANEARLLALFALKRTDEAVALVERWREAEGSNQQVLRLAARAYREAGRLSEMDGVLEELRRLAPADPRVRVYAIVQTLLAGREAEGRALIDDYIFRFGGQARNFTVLATPLAEIGRLPELDLVIAAARERGFRDAEFGQARLRLLVSARRWREVRAQIEAIRVEPVRAGAPASASVLLDYYDAMAAALLDPARGAQSSFVDKVRPLQLSLAAYRQAIGFFRDAGHPETAREVVTFAEGVFPQSVFLETTRRELDAELSLAAAAAQPEQVVMDPTLADQALFFAALDEAGKQKTPATGLVLIRDLRRARPGWLEGEQEAVTRAELGLHSRGDDLVALQGVARVYLNGDQQRIDHVAALASDLFEGGRKEEARLLLDEILRRTPGESKTTRLRDRFFPPPPEATKEPSAS